MFGKSNKKSSEKVDKKVDKKVKSSKLANKKPIYPAYIACILLMSVFCLGIVAIMYYKESSEALKVLSVELRDEVNRSDFSSLIKNSEVLEKEMKKYDIKKISQNEAIANILKVLDSMLYEYNKGFTMLDKSPITDKQNNLVYVRVKIVFAPETPEDFLKKINAINVAELPMVYVSSVQIKKGGERNLGYEVEMSVMLMHPYSDSIGS